MKKLLRYTFLALLWAGVAAYIVYAAGVSRRARAERRVRELCVELADSSAQGYLVSSGRVAEWLRKEGITTIGTAVDQVDLEGIERLIARNGFVESVVASVAYSGRLNIAIRPRRPSLRLLLDGFDSYVTAEGYVFSTPRASSLYVPVVTGSYRPPIQPGYEGLVRSHIDSRIGEVEQRIQQLERDKYPFYRRELKNDENRKELRRQRVNRRWWLLEGDETYKKRIVELRAKKQRLQRAYRYEERLIQEGLDKLSARQETERHQQKKLEKTYADFMKLLTFVEVVEDDDFWRSEVVQIVARATPSGALEVDLVPRSGRHIVCFGRIEEVERKFDKLLHFYRRGLGNIGWDNYSIIDIRYNDQVVCRK